MDCFCDMCRCQGSFQDTFMWPCMIKFEFEKINLMEKIMISWRRSRTKEGYVSRWLRDVWN